MNIEEWKDSLAKAIMAVLRKHGLFDRARRKDNLTDLAESLPSMSDGSTEPGKVIASDGTLVTLGQEQQDNTAILHPQGRIEP